MNKKTSKMLNEFSRFDWFSNCGKYDGDEYIAARSKTVAIKKLISRKWYNFAIPVRNRTRNQVFENNWNVDDYNAICLEVCGEAVDGLVNKLAPLIHDRVGGDPKISEAIRRDISHTLWEAEFSEIVVPVFYCPLIAPVYAAGHFPCGWDGQYLPENWDGKSTADLPEGKLLIF